MIADTLRRFRPRRRIGWLWVIITACTLVNGLRLRGRVDALQEMSDDGRGGGWGRARGSAGTGRQRSSLLLGNFGDDRRDRSLASPKKVNRRHCSEKEDVFHS